MPSLNELVNALPEVYQPIFRHPEFAASRTTDLERVATVVSLIDQIGATVERPLRVLDLGSAQGYIAFRIAERGHHVTGIESLDANVAVIEALCEEFGELDVDVVLGDIVAASSLVHLHDFDVVLGLSVLHHLLDRDGAVVTNTLVTTLASAIHHGIFEMALKEEPVFWAPSLPSDPRITLAPFHFLREVGNSATHLSDVRRPLLFASQSHVCINGELHPLTSWSDRPHVAADQQYAGLRRYFFFDGGVVKTVATYSNEPDQLVLAQYRGELANEARVLQALRSENVEVPATLDFVESPNEILLARTFLPGVLLADVVRSLSDNEKSTITEQLLAQLATFEKHELFHTDLRLWNVLWDSTTQQTHLIDFGALRDTPSDSMWPHDAHYSLAVFLIALWRSEPDQTGINERRALRFTESDLPAHVALFINALLSLPRSDAGFAALPSLWRSCAPDEWPSAAGLGWQWLVRGETARHELEANYRILEEQLRSHRRSSQNAAAVQQQEVLDVQYERMSTERDSWSRDRDALVHEQTVLSEEVERQRAHARELEDQLAQLRSTFSWKITKPIRLIRSIFK